jgi:1-deoxy-D-xylulose-5-phosphate synthase
MNDAVAHDADLIVVLNDNDMSISCSTGGLPNIWQPFGNMVIQSISMTRVRLMFSHIHNGHIIHGYINLQLMQQITYLKPLVLIILGLLMGMMLNNWSSFQCAKKRKGPRLVHVYTKKGKGFKPAEADPITYHAITKIAPVRCSSKKITSKYSDVFGQWLCDQAAQDDRL